MTEVEEPKEKQEQVEAKEVVVPMQALSFNDVYAYARASAMRQEMQDAARKCSRSL